MEQNEVNKGCIYALPLLKNLGYTYVKLIDSELFGKQIRVFDLITDKILSLKEFEQHMPNDLTYRMLMLGEPRVKKYKDKLIWFYLGMLDLDISDKIRPDFKEGIFPEDQDDWSKYKGWCVLKNMSLSNREFNFGNYDKIAHLPIWIHSSYESLTIRITAFWLKKLNINSDNFFDETELKLESVRLGILEAKYSKLYSEIPYEKWNKY